MSRKIAGPAARTAQLRAAIEDIAPRHAALPEIAGAGDGRGWVTAHTARRQHADALASHIRLTHDAKIRDGGAGPDLNVSCTAGICNTIRAWLTKIERGLSRREKDIGT